MTNLCKAIFLEGIYRAQCEREGLPHQNKAVRLAWSRAFIANRFTFTVLS